MKIILGCPRGFCAGVNRAVEVLREVVDKASIHSEGQNSSSLSFDLPFSCSQELFSQKSPSHNLSRQKFSSLQKQPEQEISRQETFRQEISHQKISHQENSRQELLAQQIPCQNTSSVYVYHEIVHNTWVVQAFEKNHVVFVDKLDQVPDGSILLFSAHGVSPVIRQEAEKRRLKIVDATCPLVERVHLAARRFAQQGIKVILLGHQGHDEVDGILGEAPQMIYRVISRQEIDALPEFSQNIPMACLMQTTLSQTESQDLLAYLQKKYPQIQCPPGDGVCFATRNRQEVVRVLAPSVSAVLVIGSKNSSNSKRLAELAAVQGKKTFLIDGPDDLNVDLFQKDDIVLITAGASAPESVVQATVRRLLEHFGGIIEEIAVREENVHFQKPVFSSLF